MNFEYISSVEISMKRSLRHLGFVLLLTAVLLSCNFLTSSSPSTLPPTASITTNLPAGVAVDTGEGLTFYDPSGVQLFKMPFPLNQFAGPNDVQIAGKYVKGAAGVPLIYHIIDKGEFLKLEDTSGSSTVLVNATAFVNIAGAPGLPIFSYSAADYQTMGKSYIFVGTLASHPATPVLTREPSPDGFVLAPLAIKVENFQPVGIWYTTTPFGIGGDIVFVDQSGLYYLDLATSTSKELMKNDHNIAGFSSDRNWVATTTAGSGVEPTLSPLALYNLQNGTNVSIPLLAGQNQRGAGDAVFSTADQYVAWAEGTGSQMGPTGNYQATVRVARIDGGVIANLSFEDLTTASGIADLNWSEPVGWLDDRSVLILVHSGPNLDATLLKLDVTTSKITVFAPGSFVGFIYP
jgi:hypothetical protein